ncbi:MAG: hypothetical protein KatS3mg087_0027 [Patescibacteria group bacterium]|nr:MAG: hypothetical protein KatS3mg087_0027 [Patescibacteria group bacterium]
MLNPALYNRLKQLFGKVKVVNDGVRLEYKLTLDPITNFFRPVITTFGEAYAVNCPFCVYKVHRPDRRMRLYINHHWGVPLPEAPFIKMKELIKCFNEDCVQDEVFAQQLWDMVYEGLPPPQDFYVMPTEEQSNQIEPIPPNIPITNLPVDHPACEFLINRGFDPYQIGSVYKVGYCEVSAGHLKGHIVMPIEMDGALVGWQARAIYPTKRKYYTCKGMRTSRVFYGYDLIPREYDYVVLVEGIFDVWRVGPPAVALFGTATSMYHQEILLKRGVKDILIMLDADARKKAEKIAEQLSRCFNTIIVDLPSGDPADFTREKCWAFIDKSLEAALSSRRYHV